MELDRSLQYQRRKSTPGVTAENWPAAKTWLGYRSLRSQWTEPVLDPQQTTLAEHVL